MILSEWRKTAPNRECLSNKVLAVLKPVLADLGADGDPDSWIVWGDDPAFRYSVMTPTPAGLIVVGLRLGGVDDARANGKLVRWGKVQVSELSVEASGGHRIVAVQVEGQVLKGVDDEADRICEFTRGLLAGIDGRGPWQAMAPVLVQALPQTAPVPKVVPSPKAQAKPEAPAPKRQAAAPGPAEKPGLMAVPSAGPNGGPAAAESPSGLPVRPRKPARTPGGKTQPAWVAPHPIGLPSKPEVQPPAAPGGHQPSAAKPAGQRPTLRPAIPAVVGKPAEGLPDAGPVWEVPQTEPGAHESKRPRTWTP